MARPAEGTVNTISRRLIISHYGTDDCFPAFFFTASHITANAFSAFARIIRRVATVLKSSLR
jgi:hypothetical protein